MFAAFLLGKAMGWRCVGQRDRAGIFTEFSQAQPAVSSKEPLAQHSEEESSAKCVFEKKRRMWKNAAETVFICLSQLIWNLPEKGLYLFCNSHLWSHLPTFHTRQMTVAVQSNKMGEDVRQFPRSERLFTGEIEASESGSSVLVAGCPL